MQHSIFGASVVVLAVPVLAEVVSYEATAFPETQGWDRSTFCTPTRWLDGGYLFQQLDAPGECGPGPGGDRDTYSRSLSEFDGAETFFVEWRVQTDGENSEFVGQAPVVLSCASFGSVNYIFTIARDLAKLNRDNLLPIVFVEIAPGVSHTHRLELFGDALYVWYIDGEVVDSGIPEGPYPSFFPAIAFRGRSWWLPNETRWEYVRWGTISAPASGDFDSDGVVDQTDIYFFVDCLLGPDYDASGPGCAWCDMNQDGVSNGKDIPLFVDAMLGA